MQDYIKIIIDFFTNIWTNINHISFIQQLELQYKVNITENYFLYWIIIYIIAYLLYKINARKLDILLLYIATPLHEIWHVIWAILTGSYIEKIKLIASNEERQQGIAGYISTRGPLSMFYWNSGIILDIIRFILQPIISLWPIIFLGIIYIFLLNYILWQNINQIGNLFQIIITNNYTVEEGILIGIITIIYSLSSIPSVWIGRWDLNNIKFQITGIIIMSLFITNQYFIYFSKGFLIYAIFTLFLQFIIYILLFFKK